MLIFICHTVSPAANGATVADEEEGVDGGYDDASDMSTDAVDVDEVAAGGRDAGACVSGVDVAGPRVSVGAESTGPDATEAPLQATVSAAMHVPAPNRNSLDNRRRTRYAHRFFLNFALASLHRGRSSIHPAALRVRTHGHRAFTLCHMSFCYLASLPHCGVTKSDPSAR